MPCGKRGSAVGWGEERTPTPNLLVEHIDTLKETRRPIDYIHFSPVKHRLAMHAVDGLYFSIHRYMQLGLVDADWVSDAAEKTGFGE